MRQRRALSQRGGQISQAGDPRFSVRLHAALAAADSSEAHDLTHGFHGYPARMHPVLARELVRGLADPGQIVLDPFAGSGTVLVEALVAGCKPQGVDLSPLALRVAELHCALRDARSRARFASTAAAVAQASEARVRERAAVDVPISRNERAYYQPHVMLELSGLWAEIQAVEHEADRRALEMVFSSILIKFSRLRADTSDELAEKRIRKGLTTEFFARKASELELRWEALWDAAPREAYPAKLMLGDARRLPQLLGARFRADLIVTSPPYGGTYDYAAQHARRSAWLGLDLRELRAAEIGARRNAEQGGAARWDRELGAVLDGLAAVLARDGKIALWQGDAELAGERIPADAQIARLAPKAGLELLASAAQERADARGGPVRREHVLLLGKKSKKTAGPTQRTRR
ncbi:MAG TPA: DNA methyltransferase [Polyangiales bacterium]|nr:DNA methyltransferase [Polyangiales bacterium]